MPNYNGVWSLSTQYQYAATWSGDNISPAARLAAGRTLFGASAGKIYKIDFISTADRSEFGDLSVGGSYGAAVASSTRAVWGGGSSNRGIDHAVFASEGNASDFGDLSVTRFTLTAASNSTRGLFAGGEAPSVDARVDVVDYITVGSTGNATDFGDLTSARSGPGGESSATRGVFFAGNTGSASNIIDYITIASAGNASDFGDAAVAIGSAHTSGTNSIKAIFVVSGNKFEQITIASTGNATEFGDTAAANIGGDSVGGASNAHGGIA